jgi:hypothetical protein
LLDRDATGATYESGVELVDVPRVVERPWEIRPDWAILRWGGRTLAYGPRAALSSALAVTGHSCAPALASLLMAGVATAPATVLTQRHPVWVVALALICLVVTVLALLACEGDCNPNVSASHS